MKRFRYFVQRLAVFLRERTAVTRREEENVRQVFTCFISQACQGELAIETFMEDTLHPCPAFDILHHLPILQLPFIHLIKIV